MVHPKPSETLNSDSLIRVPSKPRLDDRTVTPPPKQAASNSPVRGASGNDDKAEGFGVTDATEMDQWMNGFASKVTLDFESQLRVESDPNYHRTTLFGFSDISPFIRSATQCFVSDSFTQCFESKQRIHWNFTFYLAPLYFVGVLFRYLVLFPLRVLILIIGFTLFMATFILALPFGEKTRTRLNAASLWILAKAFLLSWCAVLREHGVVPPREPGQIYVANHTSVIDVVLLLGRSPFSLTGQAHGGLLGFFQNHVVNCMENLWFDRLASRDRAHVARKIKEHAADITKPPLLVFPEGTCVNNEYVVMFKRGAFELGSSIVPVAIKYNKIFVDAFWNSRAQSFAQHLFSLMTSWAVVCDVHYMEPQYRQQGESSVAFAARVKEMIANRADLVSVPWDGYLKYFKPKPEMKLAQQKVFAKLLLQRFGPEIDAWKARKEATAKLAKAVKPAPEVLVPPSLDEEDESDIKPAHVRRRRIISEGGYRKSLN